MGSVKNAMFSNVSSTAICLTCLSMLIGRHRRGLRRDSNWTIFLMVGAEEYCAGIVTVIAVEE